MNASPAKSFEPLSTQMAPGIVAMRDDESHAIVRGCSNPVVKCLPVASDKW